MTEPGLPAIFPGATQTADSITIPKSALPSMTPEAFNRGDTIAAAILIALKNFYAGDRREANPSVSIIAELGRISSATDFDSGVDFVNRPITFNLFSPLELPDLSADSY